MPVFNYLYYSLSLLCVSAWYSSLEECCCRLPMRSTNERVVATLVCAGVHAAMQRFWSRSVERTRWNKVFRMSCIIKEEWREQSKAKQKKHTHTHTYVHAATLYSAAHIRYPSSLMRSLVEPLVAAALVDAHSNYSTCCGFF